MSKLLAMQLELMGVRPVPSGAIGSPAPRPTTAAQTIALLRATVAAERKARLAAEARLRAVLAEIARRPAAVAVERAASTPAPAFPFPALPPAAAESVVEVEAEVVEEGDSLGAMRDAMMDGDEESDDYAG